MEQKPSKDRQAHEAMDDTSSYAITRYVSKEEFDLRTAHLKEAPSEDKNRGAHSAYEEILRRTRAHQCPNGFIAPPHSEELREELVPYRPKDNASPEATLYDPIAILGRRWAKELPPKEETLLLSGRPLRTGPAYEDGA